tara:strand:+ start:3217 stop:3393 length:177 start_codon:yes stop_codon:yes gene_type:complete
MNRERAISICKNLLQTMSKISSNTYDDSMFDLSQTKKEKLKKIYDSLVKKYKIEEAEI